MTAPVLTMPQKRYPAGPITPHGQYHILKGLHPVVQLKAFDDSIWWDLMGGRAIPSFENPEVVQIKRDGLKGLVPPWKTIDQKGAVEDGVHFVDALYDPIEVDMQLIARARDARYLRQVVRDLIGSIDVKQTSKLSWFTTDMGSWWSEVRWFKTLPDSMDIGGQRRTQDLSLTLRGDNGFWRTHDDVAYVRAPEASVFLDRKNIGDQPMYDRYTCVGPGTFRFANGPGSTQMVEFGPLLPNQVAQLRIDPRRRQVINLTSVPASPQEYAQFVAVKKNLLTLTQVLSVFNSIFGILGIGAAPPQGNMYSLLKGRWSDAAAIPAKSPGAPAQTYKVRVEITGGNSQTGIIAAGTPLRRLPY